MLHPRRCTLRSCSRPLARGRGGTLENKVLIFIGYTIGRAVAPFAEWGARAFWLTGPKPARQLIPATRLTQGHRREAKGGLSLPSNRAPRPQYLCGVCGTSIETGKIYCAICAVAVSRENLVELAKAGRVAAQSPESGTISTCIPEQRRRDDNRSSPECVTYQRPSKQIMSPLPTESP